MKIIICDDEKQICDKLAEHLRQYYQSMDVLILSVSSGEELLQLLEREAEGILGIFLDIEMDGLDGLETARCIQKRYSAIPILLLTSHTELAMEGYEVQAFRFLAKPLRQEKLAEALQALDAQAASRQKLRIMTGDREIYVDCQNVVYIKSENVYLNIMTTKKNFLMRGKLKEFGAALPADSFCQIHRSYIVNLAHVRSFDGKKIEMDQGEHLPVSGRRKEMFRDKMTTYLRRK